MSWLFPVIIVSLSERPHMLHTMYRRTFSSKRAFFLFRLWAYVLMPNHVHLFIYPTQNEYKIAALLQSIKGKTSKRYRDILLAERPERYDKLFIKTGNKKVFRFWQAGGGFDSEIFGTPRLFIVRLTILNTTLFAQAWWTHPKSGGGHQHMPGTRIRFIAGWFGYTSINEMIIK